jgi:uncharacterized protein YdcH (DUF465 family)
MERNAQEELKAHLMESNEEFQRLARQHSDLAKMKLRLKDQMEAILSQYRSRQVA